MNESPYNVVGFNLLKPARSLLYRHDCIYNMLGCFSAGSSSTQFILQVVVVQEQDRSLIVVQDLAEFFLKPFGIELALDQFCNGGFIKYKVYQGNIFLMNHSFCDFIGYPTSFITNHLGNFKQGSFKGSRS